jgi:hypothetical protein
MESGSIVEALDEGEDIALGFGTGLILAMMDELGLQGVEEALRQGIVVQLALRLIDAVMPASDRTVR